MSYCPNCGKQIPDDVKFCDACGAQITEAAPAAPTSEPVVAEPAVAEPAVAEPVASAPVAEPAAESLLDKIKAIFSQKFVKVGVAAVAVVLVLAILISIIVPAKAPDGVFFVKDGELNFFGMSGKAWEFTDLDKDENVDGLPVITKDGNKIFYVVDGDLFVNKVGAKVDKADEVASEVDTYYINEEGTKVIYVTYDGNLYSKKVGKDGETKIDEDINDVVVSKDLSRVVYTKAEEPSEESEDGNTTYDVFLWKGKKSVELVTGIDELENYSENLGVIYYEDEDSLYKKTGTKDAVEITDKFGSMYYLYDSGEFYYTERDEEGKETLFFYDGKKSAEVEMDYHGFDDYSIEKPVMVAYSIDEESLDKKYKIVVNGVATDLDIDTENVYVDRYGKKLYYLEKVKAEEGEEPATKTDLYAVQVSGKKAKAPKLVDSDVSVFGFRLSSDGTVWYFKNVDDENVKGDLWKDGKQVDTDIIINTVQYSRFSKVFAYYKTQDDKGGKLRISKNGRKPMEVASEVKSFQFTNDGKIVYLADVNDKGKGDLYLNKISKKSKIVAEGVTGCAVVPYWNPEAKFAVSH